MRLTLSLAAMVAVFAPAGALAADPCSRTPADAVATFGEPAGVPEDGRTAYMPPDLKMLDHDISYVLVMRKGADGPVEEIAYRIKGLVRKTGAKQDPALARAFDDAFYGATCTQAKSNSCSAVYDPAKTEGFAGADLNAGSLWLEDKRTGPAIGLIKADMDLADASPVFLVCIYEPQ